MKPIKQDLPGTVKPGPSVGRHAILLSDPKVRSWWENKRLRSRLSADQYLRQLGHLLERMGEDTRSVIGLAKKEPDRLRNLLIKDAAELKRDGKLDSYISKFSVGLKSYLKFNHVSFDGYPSLSSITGASLSTERVPTPEELGRVLERLSLRGRVTALFMAHSGVRPGVLGAYQAERGLRLRDIPDLDLDKVPSFAEIPFVVRVPADISKTRTAYTTFGSSQLATAFLAYLSERQEDGEVLGPGSPVVVARKGARGAALRTKQEAEFQTQFVSTTKLMVELHAALSSCAPAGVRWRPYVLRGYCSTRLLMAEGAGKVTRDLREAILGHDLGVSGRYTLGKAWGPDLLKEARRSYQRAETYLNTVQVNLGEDVFMEMRKEILLGLGYSLGDLKEMELGEIGNEKFQELVAAKRAEMVASVSHLTPPSIVARRTQKVVDESEIDQYLDQGWTVHTTLGGGKRVVLNSPWT